MNDQRRFVFRLYLYTFLIIGAAALVLPWLALGLAHYMHFVMETLR